MTDPKPTLEDRIDNVFTDRNGDPRGRDIDLGELRIVLRTIAAELRKLQEKK